MRIECDSCGAQYNIADEKVAGKMLKVRCKKCGNMIPVDGRQVAAPGAGATPANQHAVVAAVGEWFIVVAGEQQGPLSVEEIKRRVQGGELPGDTYVWKDGMGDWERIADHSSFSDLFRPAEERDEGYDDEATRVVAAPAHDVVLGGASSLPGVTSFPTGAISALSSEPRRAAFAGAAPVDTGRDAFFSTARSSAISGPESAEPRPVGARNESSVLFSLDSLAGAKAKTAPLQAEASRSEESGLINIQGLLDAKGGAGAAAPAAAAPSPAAGALSGGGASAMGAPMAMPTAALPALPPQRSNTLVIVAVVALVAILGMGGVIVYLLLQPPASAPVVAEAPAERPAPAPAPEAQPEPPAADEAAPAQAAEAAEAQEPDGAGEPVAAGDDSATEAAAPVEAGARAAQAPREAAASAVAAPRREAPAAAAQAQPAPAAAPAAERRPPTPTSVPIERPGARQPEPARTPPAPAQPPADDRVASVLESIRGGQQQPQQAAPAPSAAPAAAALPSTLSREDVMATMRRYNSRFHRCRRSDADAGSYRTSFVIQPSGSVTNVAVDQSNDAGTCIAGVVRDISFPRFSGDPMPVTYPIRIE